MMTALVAAYLFVFQLLLGSAALGTAAAKSVPLDDFGNPLCITHTDPSGGSGHKDDSRLPECCTQACCMSVPLLALQSSSRFLSNRLEPLRPPIQAERDRGPFERPETEPGTPRAPPAAV